MRIDAPAGQGRWREQAVSDESVQRAVKDVKAEPNVDAPIRVANSGYFVAHVGLLDQVAAGQPIGEVLDLAGEPIEEIRANRDGRVAMIRGLPVIHAGEGAFLLTGELLNG